MSEPPTGSYASSFRDLRVYQSALDLAHRIFLLSGSFPKDERYSLTDQIRRSSRSISANIAEAWGKRRYPAAFVAKLSDSLGETFETQTWLDHSLRCGYMLETQHNDLDAICVHIGAMLRSMENKAESFSGPVS
ncbi:MAG: four helix bundle protein [Verrucomicrobiota bacterium]